PPMVTPLKSSKSNPRKSAFWKSTSSTPRSVRSVVFPVRLKAPKLKLPDCWADTTGVTTKPLSAPIAHSDNSRRRVIGTLLSGSLAEGMPAAAAKDMTKNQQFRLAGLSRVPRAAFALHSKRRGQGSPAAATNGDIREGFRRPTIDPDDIRL